MEVIDFATDNRWHDIFYGTPDEKALTRLRLWLHRNKYTFVSLYHGTWSGHPVMDKGLLPTSDKRRKSYQSSNGFVYLCVYPGMANDFGRMAYVGKPITVYKVTLCVRRLRPDLDQLANQRHHAGRDVGNTLAESLAFGHGARVKGKIEPCYLTPATQETR